MSVDGVVSERGKVVPSVLCFVEDPGAANYVSPLPAALVDRGLRVTLLSTGYANTYLYQHGIGFTALEEGTTAADVLDRIKPQMVIVGTSENPETFGFELIVQARLAGIMSIGVIDTYANASYRFRGHGNDPLENAPDWLLVADHWTKEAFVSLSYPDDRIFVTGHPHYDHMYNIAERLHGEDRKALRHRLFPKASENKKIVVFASVLSTGLNPEQFLKSDDYTLTGRGKSIYRTEIVMEEFLDAIQLMNPRPFAVLRLHPKQKPEEYADYLEEFDMVSNGGAPFELIYGADLVVGLATMLLIESAILGTPCLAIVPKATELDSLPTIRSGITPSVTTRERLRHVLPALLKVASRETEKNMDHVIVRGSLGRIIQSIQHIMAQV